MNERIYLFFRSGTAIGNLEGTMAKYDPMQNAYLGPVSMVSNRSAYGCAVLNGAIYVAGGYRFFSVSQTSDYLEEYRPPLD